MVTSRIITYDPERRAYRLPAEHAASITRAAGSGNIATWMQFLACVGTVEQDIVECFRKGGGVPYAKYGRFHTPSIWAEAPGSIGSGRPSLRKSRKSGRAGA